MKPDQRFATPPNDIQAEIAVLGALLLDNSAWERVADKIRESDFYRKDHRLIFRGIAQLLNSDSPADVVTVGQWIEANNLVSDTGGIAVLASLANAVASAANIEAYANIVREKSLLRQLIEVSSEISRDAFNPNGKEAVEILEGAEKRVFGIMEQHAKGKGEAIPMQDAVRDAMKYVLEMHEMEGTITGLPTGFTDLDAKTAGLQKSDLIIIAGRPSMGKTTLAMNIAEHAALHEGQTVLVFSMEMSALQLSTRTLASTCQIPLQALRTGDLDDMQFDMLTQAKPRLDKARIFIDETPALSHHEVRARARRIKREHGLGLIVIDYIQLMQIPGRTENRNQEISEISRNLKALAKELDVPVIALSQLNRQVDSRQDKRPVMSDLRESGSIEQDADVIAFVYRDVVYNPDTELKNKAEIIIAKQRNGETGTVNLVFQGQFCRFHNYIPLSQTYAILTGHDRS